MSLTLNVLRKSRRFMNWSVPHGPAEFSIGDDVTPARWVLRIDARPALR